MSQPEMKRRDFLAGTVGVVGGAGVVGCSTLRPALAETPPVPVLDAEAPLARYWEKPVFEVATVDLNTAAPELRAESVKERHRIYCILLMKVIERFWNGNKRGPFGDYPRRVKQLEAREPTARYRGDMIAEPDRFRINWDRYLGHNIACLAVDGNGEVIDFDFNHNDFFRSSAEHAESRMVRRLFSLTDIHQHWKTGEPIPGRSRAFSLKDVTLYTSLESCAQCSGVMSLGRVKQVVYLQSDPGTYVIGNIMYNLAGVEGGDGSSLAPLPIPGAAVGLPHFARLNEAFAAFVRDMSEAKELRDTRRAFFVSPDKRSIDFEPAITSFLCTDAALEIFRDGGAMLDRLSLAFPDEKHPGSPTSWTNRQCLDEARRFFQYADVEGFRGSPHKL
jgi:tRNA(Arg) A34 adenosine deaminase TadA